MLKRAIAPVRNVFQSIARAGTAGYPPDTVRRLKILNVIAALIALTNSIYALQLAMGDYETMKPVVWINLVLSAIAASVPLTHRISETAGGLILVTAEFVALLGFTAYFGRSGGAPMQYLVAAAAPFVIFGLDRLRLVIAVVVGALGLHLLAWFSFTRSDAMLTVDTEMLNSLYAQSAVTTFGLIAASVYYAFSLAERAKAETDAVLRNVLPDSIVERLKANPGQAISDGFASASILFADITGFVALARFGASAGIPIQIRIGMASGPMMAGVIGTKKFSYDVWGDPVNLASRLESASTPGRILTCPECREKLGPGYTFESRGVIVVKGVGQQEAFYLTGRVK
ncbi:MAG: adenylate/guanylate cyclase domain-containing protein [Hyphomicrobium sp.]|nr:adenylate/guanylate cyclase domain-containing protein [Hyphomicrobium sp.]